MYAGNIFILAREQTERIGIPHVLFRDERELRQILECFQIVKAYACICEGTAIKLDVVLRILHRSLEICELQFAQLFSGHRFYLGLKVLGHLQPPWWSDGVAHRLPEAYCIGICFSPHRLELDKYTTNFADKARSISAFIARG